MSRVLKDAKNQITCPYGNGHVGVDVVKYKGQLADIIAHTQGTVIEVVKNYNRTDKTGSSYGNYVLLKHPNNYYTLYAHMKYGSVKVSKGLSVKKSEVIGYMGNTGYSKGAHLHFEVRNVNNKRINPTPYLDADLPNMNKKTVSYRVYCQGKWYQTVKDGQTAGDGKNAISGIQIKTGTGCGDTHYKVHIKGGKWLSEVTTWDNTANGYAGIKGKAIDAFAFKSDNAKVSYRAKTKIGWLPWVSGYNTNDNKNGFAGNIGQSILAIEIKVS